jgi:pimeloyl-ACP methyl ester carboxylesterase
MGASAGGSITLYLATQRPDLVKRAVVIGGHLYYLKEVRELVSKWSKNPSADNISRHGQEKATLLRNSSFISASFTAIRPLPLTFYPPSVRKH